MTAGTSSGADIDGEYRYSLYRSWAPGPTVLFVMLNPSTADTIKNDPTIRRCIGFAQLWGYSGVEVVNLFALRSTDPEQLYKHKNPVGFRNDAAIIDRAARSALIVCAWGNHGTFMRRGNYVLEMLRKYRLSGDITARLNCFRMTAKNQPEHPLYQPNAVKPKDISDAT